MKKILLVVTVTLILSGSLMPFLWFVDTSLKTEKEVTAMPPELLPSGSTGFYRSSFEGYSLLNYVKNSAVVASCTTLVTLGEKIVLMDQGRIQQIGTPSEVYNLPANIFAATFIGSPRMNLVKGRLHSTGNRLMFLSDAFSFDMNMNEQLLGFQDVELVLGVRPESLITGEGNIHGTVEFVEHLGSENIIYIKTGGEKLIARTSPEKDFNSGDSISMSLQQENIHLFYEDRRIGP